MEAGDYRSQTMSLSADTRQNEAVALHDSCTEHKNQRWLHVTITEPPKPEQSWVNICGTDSFIQLGFKGGLSGCAEQASQMEVIYIWSDKKKSLFGWEVPEE